MSGLEMKYFVLKPKGDSAYAQASRRAMFAYAKAILPENPELAEQLHNWAGDEHIAATPDEELEALHAATNRDTRAAFD